MAPASAVNPWVRSRGRAPEVRVQGKRADCGFNKTRFASIKWGSRAGPREQEPVVPGRSWPLALKPDFPQACEGLLALWGQADVAPALYLNGQAEPAASKEGHGESGCQELWV